MRNNLIFVIAFILMADYLPGAALAQEFAPPKPRGGDKQAKAFVDEEMIYPAEAIKQSVEGTVILEFIVQAQGQVKEIRVQEPVNTLLKREALRIFKLIIWEPAIYRGQATESKATFEVPFSIKHYKRVCKERGYFSIELPDMPIDSSGKVYLYKYTDEAPVPVFKDKNINMQSFMAENFTYPEEALRRNITGVVKVNFIVEPHGHISNVMIVDYLGAGCAEEAIRLVKKLKWKPGVRDGKLVRVNMSIPITFGLSADGGYRVTPAAGGTSFQ